MSGPRARSADRFPSTHWSDVRDAAGGQGRAARAAALEGLLRRYLPALRVYLARKRGMSGDAADELLQSFVARKLMDERFVAAADRQRGKFRTFLLTSLDHFLIDEFRRERARDREAVALDATEAVAPVAPEHADAFDVAWARQVIGATLQRMGEECRADGREELWSLFDIRVVGPILRGEPAPSYEELTKRFGFASPTQGSNALVTAKRTFERILRSVVTEYTGSDANADDELRDLRGILGRAGARSS